MTTVLQRIETKIEVYNGAGDVDCVATFVDGQLTKVEAYVPFLENWVDVTKAAFQSSTIMEQLYLAKDLQDEFSQLAMQDHDPDPDN